MDQIVRCAERVIAGANREKAADLVLRSELHASRLPRHETSRVASIVFSYYRWAGWLDPKTPFFKRVQQAQGLDDRLRSSPESFTFNELTRSVPSWIHQEMNLTVEWLRVIQQQPHMWLRARRGHAGSVARVLGNTTPGPFPDSLEYFGEEDLYRNQEFQAGAFEIQDVASQAVGLMCAPKPGETWWDACAGEGGKLLHLSDLMDNKGLIWASDRAEWRLKRLKQRAARAKAFNYRVVPWQGGKLPTKTKFDGVLVDAPCSGVGTWQRNPHARWTTTLDDVRELAAVQKELVMNAAPAVKPGGKLIYAVCTLTRSETDEVADYCSQELSQFEPLPFPASTNEPPATSSRKWIWPQHVGGNGMYVAAWRRLP